MLGGRQANCASLRAVMTKIYIDADCGDAPERLLVRDVNVAFAQADVEGILDRLAVDIHWQIIGKADIRGKEAVGAALEAMKDVVTRELVILSIISLGTEGAANGVIRTEGGGSFAFCDFYRFTSASGEKIKLMMSYVVELNSGD